MRDDIRAGRGLGAREADGWQWSPERRGGELPARPPALGTTEPAKQFATGPVSANSTSQFHTCVRLACESLLRVCVAADSCSPCERRFIGSVGPLTRYLTGLSASVETHCCCSLTARTCTQLPLTRLFGGTTRRFNACSHHTRRLWRWGRDEVTQRTVVNRYLPFYPLLLLIETTCRLKSICFHYYFLPWGCMSL